MRRGPRHRDSDGATPRVGVRGFVCARDAACVGATGLAGGFVAALTGAGAGVGVCVVGVVTLRLHGTHVAGRQAGNDLGVGEFLFYKRLEPRQEVRAGEQVQREPGAKSRLQEQRTAHRLWVDEGRHAKRDLQKKMHQTTTETQQRTRTRPWLMMATLSDRYSASSI